ncbi:hypothetical protein AJ80_08787 [Polytolypa hystricis UAMH7299]|uniref:Uncharacterized protein n=1 Tax=Polytolypa hystricis (strain UAMH7299) TaxID=1447883 RepID=A0A2B7X1X7_POLH7|nr:hypothetical protein AJ80_08787 [Polytolypa hystricis UAMH7299]
MCRLTEPANKPAVAALKQHCERMVWSRSGLGGVIEAPPDLIEPSGFLAGDSTVSQASIVCILLAPLLRILPLATP